MLQALRWLTLVTVLGAAPSFAAAEQVRLRFVPVDASGATGQVPIGPEGAMGELKRGIGRPLPYPHVIRPNQLVTFRHPFTRRNAIVPLRMGRETPSIQYLSDRIVFSFDDYVIEVRFLPDGAVDVVYNSGALRSLRLD